MASPFLNIQTTIIIINIIILNTWLYIHSITQKLLVNYHHPHKGRLLWRCHFKWNYSGYQMYLSSFIFKYAVSANALYRVKQSCVIWRFTCLWSLQSKDMKHNRCTSFFNEHFIKSVSLTNNYVFCPLIWQWYKRHIHLKQTCKYIPISRKDTAYCTCIP